mmetsp:Transcript_7042/g.19954  ORF Transcript_7042/g.19954 Transcript_7042/m.19954 type:complete len:232 (-) Transcript_7042:529-1224(-)
MRCGWYPSASSITRATFLREYTSWKGSSWMALVRSVSKMLRMASPPPSPPSSRWQKSASKARHRVRTSCTMAPRLSGTELPYDLSSFWMVCTPSEMVDWITGICRTMASSSFLVSLAVRASMPTFFRPWYSWRLEKNSASRRRASVMDMLPSRSACARLTTAIQPWRSGTWCPSSTARALVPRSMMSSLVSTPTVRSPAGSTSRASRMASLVAMSALAGDTARMMAFCPCT